MNPFGGSEDHGRRHKWGFQSQESARKRSVPPSSHTRPAAAPFHARSPREVVVPALFSSPAGRPSRWNARTRTSPDSSSTQLRRNALPALATAVPETAPPLVSARSAPPSSPNQSCGVPSRESVQTTPAPLESATASGKRASLFA